MSIITGIYTFLAVIIISWFVMYFGGEFGVIIAPIVAIALAAAIISGQIANLKKSLISQNKDCEKESEENHDKD